MRPGSTHLSIDGGCWRERWKIIPHIVMAPSSNPFDPAHRTASVDLRGPAQSVNPRPAHLTLSENSVTDLANPTFERLEDQISWYDKKSQAAQKAYKILKLTQVIATALIPLASISPVPTPQQVTAILGLIVLVMEAAQQLNQYQQNWVSYRSTCEMLKHEKYLFLAGAGPYSGVDRPVQLLADRIEGLISQEHAKWVSAQEQSTKVPQTESKEAQSAGGGFSEHKM